MYRRRARIRVMRSEIRKLAALTDDELWRTLADEVGFGVGAQDPESLRAFARAWFESRLAQLREALCNPRFLNRIATSGEDNGVLAATAIADALAAYFSGPTLFTMSVLVTRYGLDKICGGGGGGGDDGTNEGGDSVPG